MAPDAIVAKTRATDMRIGMEPLFQPVGDQ
jgi:hypothetical protein